jgi:hypothetical protein
VHYNKTWGENRVFFQDFISQESMNELDTYPHCYSGKQSLIEILDIHPHELMSSRILVGLCSLRLQWGDGQFMPKGSSLILIKMPQIKKTGGGGGFRTILFTTPNCIQRDDSASKQFLAPIVRSLDSLTFHLNLFGAHIPLPGGIFRPR